MKIKFVPEGGEFEITPDKSVLQVAHENGIPIRSVCKGVPSCAECRVKIIEGEHNVLPPTKAEINLIGSTYFVDQRRLSCQLRCFGDVVVDIEAHLGKDEAVSKKLRGVKHTSLPRETKAVQGTMVLDEPAPATMDKENSDEPGSDPNGREDRSARPQKRKRRRNNSGGGKKTSGGGDGNSGNRGPGGNNRSGGGGGKRRGPKKPTPNN